MKRKVLNVLKTTLAAAVLSSAFALPAAAAELAEIKAAKTRSATPAPERSRTIVFKVGNKREPTATQKKTAMTNMQRKEQMEK